jgi:hypothetical protein
MRMRMRRMTMTMMMMMMMMMMMTMRRRSRMRMMMGRQRAKHDTNAARWCRVGLVPLRTTDRVGGYLRRPEHRLHRLQHLRK